MSSKDLPDNRIEAPLEKTARVVIDPFIGFIKAQSASGWVLLAATILAIAMANSAWEESYRAFVHLELGVHIDRFTFSKSLQHWVNDGLMSVFFFLLGLELKRELLVGQLNSIRHASGVMCAAIGGIVIPALLFLMTVDSEVLRRGWAMPVATDTAFALTVLLLLGHRIPGSVRAFMVGIAIVDDLAAILIIAFMYTNEIDPQWLIPAAIATAVLVVLNLTGVRHGAAYLAAGIVLWVMFLNLGVHGTMAGVIVAALAPVRPALAREAFLSRLRTRLDRFEDKQDDAADRILEEPEQQAIAADIQRAAEQTMPALNRWETRLEAPVSLLIMPLFALMNAGVVVSESQMHDFLSSKLSLAIPLGLVVGKPVGICIGVWFANTVGLAKLPKHMSMRHVIGVGLVAGIGFTMSIFIATLTFGDGSRMLEMAKQSIILSSFFAGLLGYAWLRFFCAVGNRDSN